MNHKESEAWRPEIKGWSWDILPFYRKVAELLPEGARTVEVGVYHGRSILFLCEELARLNKRAEVFGIDPGGQIWYGPGTWEEDPRPHLLRNARAMGNNWNCSPPNRPISLPVTLELRNTRSPEDASSFPDGSLDLVFIDGDHSYDACKADILAWGPKLKAGGILSGHDYQLPYWPVGATRQNEGFPGVVRAVDELAPNRTLQDTVWQR
jgi:hypothetical protein